MGAAKRTGLCVRRERARRTCGAHTHTERAGRGKRGAAGGHGRPAARATLVRGPLYSPDAALHRGVATGALAPPRAPSPPPQRGLDGRLQGPRGNCQCQRWRRWHGQRGARERRLRTAGQQRVARQRRVSWGRRCWLWGPFLATSSHSSIGALAALAWPHVARGRRSGHSRMRRAGHP